MVDPSCQSAIFLNGLLILVPKRIRTTIRQTKLRFGEILYMIRHFKVFTLSKQHGQSDRKQKLHSTILPF